jgi:hypothetical protein
MSVPTATGNCVRKTQKRHVQITVAAEDNTTRCSYTSGASIKVLVKILLLKSKVENSVVKTEGLIARLTPIINAQQERKSVIGSSLLITVRVFYWKKQSTL